MTLYPECCFCGAPSEEADHVPPQCFFTSNVAPEGYVFPACASCNRLTRLDDQVLGLLMPMAAQDPADVHDQARTNKLIAGVRNNSSPIIEEWTGWGAAERKRAFRETFGEYAQFAKDAGYGFVKLGELTDQALDRFALKLTHALFFKHAGKRFDGMVAYDLLPNRKTEHDRIVSVIRAAPCTPGPIQRSGRDLSSRFSYRFSCSTDPGLMWLVTSFGGQFLMTMLAAEAGALDEVFANTTAITGNSRVRKVSSSYFRENRLNIPSSSTAPTAPAAARTDPPDP